MSKAFAILFISYTVAVPISVDFNPLNEFSLKLLDHTYSHQLNYGTSNTAISPISVWSLLSLLAEGSSGQTYQELVRELRLPNDLKSTQSLHLSANNVLKSQFQDVTLKGQSVMFSDRTLQIHPEFCESAGLYSTDIYSVDTTNTTKLEHDINYFICLATEGRITNAVQAKNLENLRLILVDALYFKANWTYPFDPTQTKAEDFYNYQGKSIGSVNMMYHKAPHSVLDAAEIQATVLEMTYGKNEEFSMLIALPYDGTSMKSVLSNLAEKPLTWLERLRAKTEDDISEIDVYVPRFKITAKTDLIPPLQYLGITSVFDAQSAELPGVSDSPLFISSAVQNVDLEVTEEGTVASAATVIGLEDRILGSRFEANRDFVFLITERKSNLILFSGVYEVPNVF